MEFINTVEATLPNGIAKVMDGTFSERKGYFVGKKIHNNQYYDQYEPIKKKIDNTWGYIKKGKFRNSIGEYEISNGDITSVMLIPPIS